MKAETPIAPSGPPQPLNQLLNSAVVLNWDALTQSSPAARVRVEYHIGPDGALEFLKLWNGAREYWSLICEYSPRLAWSDGPRFCNGHHSRSFSRLLQSIMLNQSMCTGCNPNTNAMLEIGPPTPDDIEVARLQMSSAFGTV
ncbi:MAG: hypothetical protein ACLP00_18365 [Terracidiphilus sp.]